MPSPKTHTFAPSSLLTSYQVGALLQVNPSSVNKWIADGRIPAYRTPGGHRRIRATDLMAFLVAHKMPIPQGLTSVRPRSVLAISDDPGVFAGLMGSAAAPAAGAQGLTITVAQDSLDGLLRAGSEGPDVVLVGPTRAPLDSQELCRRLRAFGKLAGVKIALLADGPSIDGQARAKSLGADWVLHSPVHPSDLMALVIPGT